MTPWGSFSLRSFQGTCSGQLEVNKQIEHYGHINALVAPTLSKVLSSPILCATVCHTHPYSAEIPPPRRNSIGDCGWTDGWGHQCTITVMKLTNVKGTAVSDSGSDSMHPLMEFSHSLSSRPNIFLLCGIWAKTSVTHPNPSRHWIRSPCLPKPRA